MDVCKSHGAGAILVISDTGSYSTLAFEPQNCHLNHLCVITVAGAKLVTDSVSTCSLIV